MLQPTALGSWLVRLALLEKNAWTYKWLKGEKLLRPPLLASVWYDRRVFAGMQSVSLRDAEGFGLFLVIHCNCGLAAPGDCIRVMDWSE